MSTARLLVPALLLCALAVPSHAQGSMEIVVNVPAGRLDVLQGGAVVRSYPVSVGLARYATPLTTTSIRRVIWNPSWTPPPDAAWARNEKPAAPGWGNPMGRVKMHLFEDYYIHGTPTANERFLGRPASHGCIRMSNRDAMELARLVLRAEGSPVPEATLQAIIRNPAATREIGTQGRVRVRIEYPLTDVDDRSVTLYPDVYGRAVGRYAERVGEELARRGVPMDPMLAGLRVSGTALRFARMDVPRPVPMPETLAPWQAERVVIRGRHSDELAAAYGAGQ